MAFWPLRLLAKAIRVTIGLALVGWGVISFIVFILPGGLWTILIGFAILAADISAVRRLNEWLKANIQKKFPEFHHKVIAPLDTAWEKWAEAAKRWLKRFRGRFFPAFLLGAFLAGVFPALAVEIENADKMPYRLEAIFIEAIWKEVIRVSNEEAPVLKIEPDTVMPKIIYAGVPPKGKERVLAEIDLSVDKYDRVDLEKSSFAVTIYAAAFFRHLPEWQTGSETPKFFPEQAYGVIAHEFFHKTLSHQYVPVYYQHCAMVFRRTLEKVISFIERRIFTGAKITDAILNYAKGQCEKDFGGKIHFPGGTSR